jgi:hypothetical protein
MAHKLTLKFTEELVRRAAWSYLRLQLDWKLMLTSFALIVHCIYSYVTGLNMFVSGICVAVLAMEVLFFYVAHRKLQSQACEDFHRRSGKPVFLEFGESGLRFSSELGAAVYQWRDIEAYQCFAEYNLLIFKNRGYTAIPIDPMKESSLKELERYIFGLAKTHS